MRNADLTAAAGTKATPRDIRDLSDYELMTCLSTNPTAALLGEQADRDIFRYRTSDLGWKEHLAGIPQQVLRRLAYHTELNFYYRELARRYEAKAAAEGAPPQPACPADNLAVEAGARPSSPKTKSFEDLARRWEQLRAAEAEAFAGNQATVRQYSDALEARRGLERHVREALAANGAILVGEILYRNGPVGVERIPVRLGGLVPWPTPDDSQKA